MSFLVYPTLWYPKQSPMISMIGMGGGGTGTTLGGQSRTLTQTVRTFTYTGAEQDYTVPANYSNDGVQSIQLYVWGAGGGASGGMGNGYSGRAGCGGFAEGLLQLSGGTSCKIIVGQGGDRSTNTVRFGGGGGGTAGDGAGGGLSGLFETSYTHANSIIIAGGGGGSGGNGSAGKTYYGGCGGGANNGYVRGGAGGGGYYGGGCVNGVSGCGHPGGGGGSGYLHSTKITSGSFSTLLHNRSTGAVPESSNTYYQSGVGNGPDTDADGGNGLVVIVENVYV